jgi:hypothetical protein
MTQQKEKGDVDEDDNKTDLTETATKDITLAEPVLKMTQWRCSSLLIS